MPIRLPVNLVESITAHEVYQTLFWSVLSTMYYNINEIAWREPVVYSGFTIASDPAGIGYPQDIFFGAKKPWIVVMHIRYNVIRQRHSAKSSFGMAANRGNWWDSLSLRWSLQKNDKICLRYGVTMCLFVVIYTWYNCAKILVCSSFAHMADLAEGVFWNDDFSFLENSSICSLVLSNVENYNYEAVKERINAVYPNIDFG